MENDPITMCPQSSMLSGYNYLGKKSNVHQQDDEYTLDSALHMCIQVVPGMVQVASGTTEPLVI